MARHAAKILSEFDSYQNPKLLHLDAGGFANNISHEGIVKTTAMIKIFDKMYMDAINVTSSELGEDINLFLSQINGAKSKYISANIVFEDGRTLFPPFVKINTEIGEVAIIGVAQNTSKTWKTDDEELIRIEDPYRMLSAILEDLDADIVILLTDIRMDLMSDEVKKFAGIDLILGADGRNETGKMSEDSGTYISYGGKEGKYLGSMRLFKQNDKNVIDKHKMVLMKSTLPLDKEICEIVTDTMREIYEYEQQNNLEMEVLRKSITDRYAGIFVCSSCHSEQFISWKTSKHSNAWKGMQTGERKLEEICEKCHVTGFDNGGFVDIRVTPNLINVQCESCHGFGRDHVSDPENNPMPKQPDNSTCIECHDFAHSPEFNFKTHGEMIKH